MPSGDSVTVDVTTNGRWSGPTSNEPWLTISNISSENQMGNGSFVLTADANTETTIRAALVTISIGEMSQSITVSQEPYIGVYNDADDEFDDSALIEVTS